MRLRLLARQSQGNTKAEVEVAVRRKVPVAVCRPTIHGGVAPTAATVHAVRAQCSTRRIRYRAARVIAIPILAPLKNIAVQVVQAPSIWFFAADWMSFIVSIVIVPSVIAKLRFIISKTVLRRRPSTTGILPLCFGWLTINITCFFLRG